MIIMSLRIYEKQPPNKQGGYFAKYTGLLTPAYGSQRHVGVGQRAACPASVPVLIAAVWVGAVAVLQGDDQGGRGAGGGVRVMLYAGR